MPSIFTKIINGEIPSYKVLEDDNFIAFLDINPNTIGHTLCIPKKEIDNLFDLDDDLYVGLMDFSKKVATAMKKALDCKRIGISVVGFEVPHAHVHLIPINKIEDMDFKNIVKLNNEEFANVADKIKSYL
tara:strand:- start:882 stop:1271 length:390 start_codon:yes stop_codon:yes gene_type:complete